MSKYLCAICNKESKHLGHHKSHLEKKKHKQNCEIFRLTLEKETYEDLQKKYPDLIEIRNGIEDEDILLEGENEIDNVNAIQNAESNNKYTLIQNIINKKETIIQEEPMIHSDIKFYKPTQNIIWENTSRDTYDETETKRKIMSIIKGTHQIFYDKSVKATQALPDLSKILALILLRPLFMCFGDRLVNK